VRWGLPIIIIVAGGSRRRLLRVSLKTVAQVRKYSQDSLYFSLRDPSTTSGMRCGRRDDTKSPLMHSKIPRQVAHFGNHATFRIIIASNCWQICHEPRSTKYSGDNALTSGKSNWTSPLKLILVLIAILILNLNPHPALTAFAGWNLPATYVRPCRGSRST